MAKSWVAPDKDEKIRGVFSITEKTTVGFGATKQRKEKKIYLFVEEQDDGQIGVQPLNDSFVPRGDLRFITKEDLVENYVPEPEIYMEKVYPAIRQVIRSVSSAERHLKQGNPYTAEYEFKNALRVDEENIRATFGLGLTYLERGDRDKGDLVFRRLVRLNGAFSPEHKHLFNDFGIKLRKNNMYTQAMKFYSRAYQLCKDDEHLLYNMARTLYEKGSYPAALTFITKALALKPDFELADHLYRILQKKMKEQEQIH